MKRTISYLLVLLFVIPLLGNDSCGPSPVPDPTLSSPIKEARESGAVSPNDIVCTSVQTVHWKEFHGECTQNNPCWGAGRHQVEILNWLERVGSQCNITKVIRHKDRRGDISSIEVWTVKDNE